ncbi:hypothetical protein DICPUDRAFT_147871 [Dictyostelium purpureum]|uniref:histone deacetylase n=1 Tax=Dictyostelium purpureum TaxID=5786 RepID=F0Z9M5_DICPU|nr:uncharacterized protein DICPUDRAFT_147871 [Dictyostelium purpureum]EGC39350.1 hypothetical protein DICPUDRAFT_147871 [Dictyostelium purpureum]|eukprot:XP_003284138.1 hypothetical protein DICPUDRAFT_147871 [Dictyostelium purpureum]
MMSTLHQVNDLSRVGEKPACCIGAARGHCTVHCPRIEDVLYSQRKGKTNKGAQRWRCKACGTKWTSKGIIQPPPVVPDTIVNSIGFGSGPEELTTIDQLRANTRPYKKNKILDQSMIPTTPFPSLFSGANISNSNSNSNSSPNGSPIPSPPSPVSFLHRTTNSFVPILPTTTSSSSNNNSVISNSISNSVINSLRQSQNSTSSLSSSTIQQQQQQQLSQSQQGINSSRSSSSSSLSQSQKNAQTLTTKPVVVGIPNNSNTNNMNNSSGSINNSPNSNLQILSNNISNMSNSINSPSNKNILYNGQPSPQSPTNNNSNNSISNINNINNISNISNINNINNINPQNLVNGIPRPSLSNSKQAIKQSSTNTNNNNSNNNNSNNNQQTVSPQPPLSPKSLKHYQMNKQMTSSSGSSGSNQSFTNQSPKNNITSTMIHSTYGQPTPPPTKAPVSSKAPAVYHNVRIPSPTIETYQQQHQYQQQQQQQQQQHHLQQNPSQPPTPQNNIYQSNNQSSTILSRHNDLLSPIDSQIWAPIQYSWVQTHYNPSSTLLESLKRLVNSIVVFSNEISVEFRLKLINFLNILGSPSSESQYNTPLSKTVLSCIDSTGFNITRHYQMLYQTISKHHSMMEDQFVPLTEVYFDENEINRFLVFSEQAQTIEENFEFILRELSNIRDSFIMKRENIEKNIVESSKMISYNHSNIGSSGSNLEQAKQDTARLLETLAPLESTLNGMETKFKAIQREIGMVQRVFSFFELLYNIHISYHQSIVEKHSKQLSTYIIDVMQQTLFNCDVLSVAYNRMKSSIYNNQNNDDDSLIDTSNPFINKLTDLINKYENIRSSSSLTTPNNSTQHQQQYNNSNNNSNNLQLYQPPKDKKVLAVYHTMCLEHRVPDDHPESPKRLQSVIKAINDFARQSDRLIIKDDPEDANDKWILTVHSPEYLKQLDELTEKLDSNEIRPLNVNNDGAQTGINQFNSNGSSNGDCEDGDTFISKSSLRAAKRSAGATLYAIDSVMKGNVSSAFVAARPPGHHAGRDGLTQGTSSQGFCLLNHVCIGAKYAQLKYNLEKIAIIDFDVHHGNGTEEILANDQGFFFLSIHMFEEGFYPGSGGSNSMAMNDDDNSISINPSSNVVNIPLDPKSSAHSFLKAFSAIIDKLNDYQPELILISCGFDAHLEDNLASLCLLEENYVEITRQLRKVADRWSKGRLVSILEGGYNINALRQCTIAHLSALVETD